MKCCGSSVAACSGVTSLMPAFAISFALPNITHALAARGIPAARLVLVAGSVFQIVAGIALIAGIQTLWAAVGLIVFTLIASVMLVNFWSMEGPARAGAIGTWKSNLALIGGLLITAAHSL
jgi:putative oxidoreductase